MVCGSSMMATLTAVCGTCFMVTIKAVYVTSFMATLTAVCGTSFMATLTAVCGSSFMVTLTAVCGPWCLTSTETIRLIRDGLWARYYGHPNVLKANFCSLDDNVLFYLMLS